MIVYKKQETDYYCGPAVVQMALAHAGIIFTQEELVKQLHTVPDTGTTADAIVSLLRLHGLEARRRNGAALEDIRNALNLGSMAIVGYIESGGEPHYALVTTVTNDKIILADPLVGEKYSLPLSEFEERWRDDSAGAYGNRMLISIS